MKGKQTYGFRHLLNVNVKRKGSCREAGLQTEILTAGIGMLVESELRTYISLGGFELETHMLELSLGNWL